jgi:hypothetical protein
MIDRTTQIQSPELTPLNEQELVDFRQLCESSDDDNGQTLLSRLHWHATDIARAPYGRMDSYWAIRSAEHIENDETLATAYGRIYDTDDIEILRKLFSLDLFAWNRLHALGSEYYRARTPAEYPDDSVYHLDAGYTHDVITGAQPRFRVPLEYNLDVRRAEDNPDQDPAIIKRLQFGMPRPLQLLGLTLMMQDFGAHSYSAAKHEASRLSGTLEFLQISNDELHASVQLARANGPTYIKATPELIGSKLLNTVLTNDKLMERFHSDGVFDLRFFGGEKALHGSIRATFSEVVSTNAKDIQLPDVLDFDRYAMHQWRRLHELVGADYIAQVIPKEERTRQVITAALESMTKNMVTYDVLSLELKSLIDPAEFAQACWDVYSFWQANPDDAYKLKGQYQAPVSLRALRLEEQGIPNLRPDVLLDRERPCRQLLEQVVSNSEEGSERFDDALERLATAERYDATLLDLLVQSTDIVNHDDLRIYIDGFDGSDETTQWIKERNANAAVLRAKLEQVSEQIKQYVSQLHMAE